MFDWNEDEEVTDTIWGVLNETEDHIVPYPKENEAEFSKSQRREQIISLDETKSDKNEFPDKEASDFDANEELSASRFDLDPWPDLPSLNSTFDKGYIGDYSRSTPMVNAPESMVNGLYGSDAAIVETKDDSLKDPCGQAGSSFLDCDWGNITDFDDFDRIFRNDDSLFEHHDIISHGDGDSSAPTSFSIPNLGEKRENACEEREEHKISNPSDNDEVDDDYIMEDDEKCDHSPERVEKQKKSFKSRKKPEDKSPGIVIPQFKPPSESYQIFRPSFEYPGPRVYQASWKHPSMTPQEKIEKLRRRQQMQAVLAIQQQQQQIEQKSSSTEMSATQLNPSLQSSDEGEDFQRSILIDDSLGEKIFYQLQDAISKLEVGVRLCIRDSLFRLAKSAVERNYARERSSANKSSRDERESSIEEDNNTRERSMKMLPAETGTNPIDRVVAHLLFHWPSEQTIRMVKEEMPLSPSFPASKQSNFGEGKVEIENPPEAQDQGP